MKNIFTLLAAVLLTATTYAQVGIGTTTLSTSKSTSKNLLKIKSILIKTK
jgi:hypothetical protein